MRVDTKTLKQISDDMDYAENQIYWAKSQQEKERWEQEMESLNQELILLIERSGYQCLPSSTSG